jgi:hypothetical protein
MHSISRLGLSPQLRCRAPNIYVYEVATREFIDGHLTHRCAFSARAVVLRLSGDSMGYVQLWSILSRIPSAERAG